MTTTNRIVNTTMSKKKICSWNGLPMNEAMPVSVAVTA
jgi:hypothetical protein